jgi:putative membrane protein
MFHWFSGGQMLWMALSWLFGILLFVVIIWIVARAIRPGDAEHSPEAILRRRYAAGEINTEEFESRLATLRKGRSEPGSAR